MKRKWFLIATAGIVAGAFWSANAYDGKQVNARAVSTFWRYISWEHGDAAQCGDGNNMWDGSLVLYTIRNAQVTRADTIYRRSLGLAQCPVFNLSGTKIAFYRSGRGPDATTPTKCATVNDGKAHISMINSDGTGLTDLCDLANEPISGENMPQYWPAGDWIYYFMPRTPAEMAQAHVGESRGTEVWKVNCNTKVNVKVCDLTRNSGVHYLCDGVRRFTLNLSATSMALGSSTLGCSPMLDPGWWGGNSIWKFPPPICNLDQGLISGAAGCNISISPSGLLKGSYFAGNHDFLILALVNGGPCPFKANTTLWENSPDNTSGMHGVTIKNDLEKWAGGFIGNGAEHIRWAVNSDKWIMQQIGMVNSGHANNLNYGSNQVVCNPIDNVVINISNHGPTAADGYTCLNNDAGAMYIEDPVNNPNNTKYEDLQGVWHVVPEATPVAIDAPFGNRSVAKDGTLLIKSKTAGMIRLSVPSQGAWKITVSGVDGRIIRSLKGTGAGDVALSALVPVDGILLITLTQGGKPFVNRLIIR